MWSRSAVVAFGAVLTAAQGAWAQSVEPGFALDRFTRSPAGAGWFVMDALDMSGAPGGAVSLGASYARNPLVLGEGAGATPVVQDLAVGGLDAAVTYDRLRFSLGLDSPVLVHGQAGTVGTHAYAVPDVNPSTHPDLLSDLRLGVDARLFGHAASVFRLGLGAQLLLPFGAREDYVTDGTVRGAVRVLVAGDTGWFTYAAHAGLHLRPLDMGDLPGGPRGSELLLGAAVGARIPFGGPPATRLVVGPEVFGGTALRTPFGRGGSAVEALLSARLEGAVGLAMRVRVKLGVGFGSGHDFGAPDWRIAAGVEFIGWNAAL